MRDTLQSIWMKLLCRWWPAILAVGLYFILTVTAIAGAHMLNLEHGVLPAGSSDQAMRWPGVWARWDSGYYLTIARNGYSASNATPAFYPLYPLILRFIKIVTNLDVVSIGTIFSTIFTTIAFLVIFNTFSADFDISINKDIILLLSLFPTAFFLFSIYTESLFLFLSIIVYCLTQRKKVEVGGFIMFFGKYYPR
jgi:hypothetical protein